MHVFCFPHAHLSTRLHCLSRHHCPLLFPAQPETVQCMERVCHLRYFTLHKETEKVVKISSSGNAILQLTDGTHTELGSPADMKNDKNILSELKALPSSRGRDTDKHRKGRAGGRAACAPRAMGEAIEEQRLERSLFRSGRQRSLRRGHRAMTTVLNTALRSGLESNRTYTLVVALGPCGTAKTLTNPHERRTRNISRSNEVTGGEQMGLQTTQAKL